MENEEKKEEEGNGAAEEAKADAEVPAEEPKAE